ncbi:hypothetical protein CN912_21785 [Bacillus cereus]|uniref:hypothetical protein n=1 Tax=Bacillus cereus group TaxID=86661 RepID=UPI000A36CA84|nr:MULTISPECIES: hypothetical protein [Bacillus cereus group]OUA60513.1 hypothetical protein BK785_08065 [Bacillus thuringiensis serovar bolivia]OUA77375.1 hypothetical protein BK787_10700 [Bacillus thuringiensis serovar pahangi]PER15773.1 hypothetical protein CN484_20465 [Bacillus cereus]PGL07875.1 hypothetical protein CN912_21785 [Bacillus cereus]
MEKNLHESLEELKREIHLLKKEIFKDNHNFKASNNTLGNLNLSSEERIHLIENDLAGRETNIKKFEHLKVKIGDEYDWSPAIQKAIDDCLIFSRENGFVLDLFGCEYTIGAPILLPPGKHFTIKNGKLVAHHVFPRDRYLLETNKRGKIGIFSNEDLVLLNLQFDNRFRGGGLLLENYNRVVVDFCKFFQYETDGICLNERHDSHEAIVMNSFFQECFWDHPHREERIYKGTAINVKTNDNHFSNNIIACSKNGIIVDSQYNIFHSIHVWGTVKSGLYVTSNASFNSFSQMYFDCVNVIIENPWHIEIVNSKFLHVINDTSFSFITLKPMFNGVYLEGLKILGNSFANNLVEGERFEIKAVSVDNKIGTFSDNNIQQTVIDDNSFSSVTPAYSRYHMKVYELNQDTWVGEFSTMLPLGKIQKVQYTLQVERNAFFKSWIDSIDSHRIVIKSEEKENGTLWIYVDVNN